MCQTMYDHYDWELSAGINSPKEGCYIAHQTMTTAVTSRFKCEWYDWLEFQDEC